MPDSLFPQTNMEQLLELQEPKPQVDEDYNRLFDYSQIAPRLKVLAGRWNVEVNETIRRRLIKNIDLSPKKLRDEGRIKQDETIVPIRLVLSNILREAPEYINYLVTPARLNIFKDPCNSEYDCQNIEREWSTGMRYEGWAIPHIRCLDGAQTHGWDAVEVVYDPEKPLHVAIEHVGHENLYFSFESVDFQACEVVMRKYSLSLSRLKTFIKKYGFDPIQTNKVIDNLAKGENNQDRNATVFKIFFKFNEVVYVAWYCDQYADSWLKAPAKLFLGIRNQVEETVMTAQPLVDPMTNAVIGMQQVPVKQKRWVDADVLMFPIFIQFYSESEEQALVMHRGRVFFDMYKQEAQTAIATGFVNGTTRASNIYASVKGDPGSTAAPKQLSTTLTNGAIFDREIEFFNTPYPDPVMLQGMQVFNVQNMEETGAVAFASMTRQDGRKTSKEMSMAEQQQAKLSNVQVVLFSIHLTKVYNFCWQIAKSLALQGIIRFMANKKVEPNIFDPANPKVIYENDYDAINRDFVLTPAGDVDIIERQQMLSQMKQDWPVFQQTPIANLFLNEYIKRAYPKLADTWIPYLQQQNQLREMLKMGLMMMTRMANGQPLNPQEMQQMGQYAMQVQQAISGPDLVSGQIDQEELGEVQQTQQAKQLNSYQQHQQYGQP